MSAVRLHKGECARACSCTSPRLCVEVCWRRQGCWRHQSHDFRVCECEHAYISVLVCSCRRAITKEYVHREFLSSFHHARPILSLPQASGKHRSSHSKRGQIQQTRNLTKKMRRVVKGKKDDHNRLGVPMDAIQSIRGENRWACAMACVWGRDEYHQGSDSYESWSAHTIRGSFCRFAFLPHGRTKGAPWVANCVAI